MGAAQLSEVLRHLAKTNNPGLLLGFETGDDAGLFELPGGLVLVQTVDFFTPIVDDPYAFGAIAAANALSDIYAMGGKPLTALNIAAFNMDLAPPEVWARVLQGAQEKVEEAGAVVVGGHTVEDAQPKFGVAVTGILQQGASLRNDTAQPGQQLYLTKPLGTGILTTAAKRDLLGAGELQEAIESMSRLNREAAEVAILEGVTCGTDVTGFGLAGHAWNIARNSQVRIVIEASAVPLLSRTVELAEKGVATGGAKKTRDFLSENLVFMDSAPGWAEAIFTDPQTSGGLLLAAPAYSLGVRIGWVEAGSPAVVIR